VGKDQLVVSIVTPSLNQGEFIEETILSVKNQEYPNIEHIIVDGGSVDNTLEILKRHEKTYNMRWISEPDEGMYQAINKGMRLAKGEVLAYLNADDLYFPWTVKAVVRALEKNSKVDMVYGDCLVLEGKEATLLFSIPSNSFISKALIPYVSLTQPVIFWRRGVFEKLGGFDESLQFVGDLDYWIRVAKKFKVMRIKEFLAVDRRHPQSKSSIEKDAMLKEIQEVRSKHFPNRLKICEQAINHLYLFLWMRYNVAKFLSQYFLKARKHGSGWFHLLNVSNLNLPSLWQCLLDFLPFPAHKEKPKWSYIDVSLIKKIILLVPNKK
jgi:glycosyltransferase involved in cell wall biosynthesis